MVIGVWGVGRELLSYEKEWSGGFGSVGVLGGGAGWLEWER